MNAFSTCSHLLLLVIAITISYILLAVAASVPPTTHVQQTSMVGTRGGNKFVKPRSATRNLKLYRITNMS